MNKHDIVAAIIWLAILSVLIYNIGIATTVIILLALFIGSLLYIGVP